MKTFPFAIAAFVLLSSALLFSCDEDEEVTVDVPKAKNLQITSFSSEYSEGVKVGEPFNVQIEGLGTDSESMIDSTWLIFTGIDKPVRVKPNSMSEYAISIESVSDSATSGRVTVEIGESISATPSFSLKFAPTIKQLQANSISTGDTLLLQGFNFSTEGSIPKIVFEAQLSQDIHKVEAEILEYSPFDIRFIVPYNLLNTPEPFTLPQRMIITNEGMSEYVYDFEVVNPLLSYGTSTKIWNGGQVNIVGTNFSFGLKAFLGDYAIDVTQMHLSSTNTEEMRIGLTEEIPLGTYPIRVESNFTPGRPGKGLDLEVIERPVITVDKLKGSIGTTITISGADFTDASELSFSFSDTSINRTYGPYSDFVEV